MIGEYSPHAWGWTFGFVQRAIIIDVFPTRVGVDLNCRSLLSWLLSIPHTRGGGPLNQFGIDVRKKYSPHAWGWTATLANTAEARGVFPTRVGVDRTGQLPAG